MSPITAVRTPQQAASSKAAAASRALMDRRRYSDKPDSLTRPTSQVDRVRASLIMCPESAPQATDDYWR